MSDLLGKVLTDEKWIRENETAIKALFPADWQHMSRINVLKVGFNFKLLRIDWRTMDEFSKVLVYLAKIGIIEHDPDFKEIIRANPKSIFESYGK